MVTVEKSKINVSIEYEDGTITKGVYECVKGNVEEAACQYRNMEEGILGEMAVFDVDVEDLKNVLTENGLVFEEKGTVEEVYAGIQNILDEYQDTVKGHSIILHIECNEQIDTDLTEIADWMAKIMDIVGDDGCILPSVTYLPSTQEDMKMTFWIS